MCSERTHFVHLSYQVLCTTRDNTERTQESQSQQSQSCVGIADVSLVPYSRIDLNHTRKSGRQKINSRILRIESNTIIRPCMKCIIPYQYVVRVILLPACTWYIFQFSRFYRRGVRMDTYHMIRSSCMTRKSAVHTSYLFRGTSPKCSLLTITLLKRTQQLQLSPVVPRGGLARLE